MSGAISMYDGLDQEASPNDHPLETSGGATKKLARGISRATENAAIVSHVRSQLASLSPIEIPEFTFSLPDLSVYPGKYLIINL